MPTPLFSDTISGCISSGKLCGERFVPPPHHCPCQDDRRIVVLPLVLERPCALVGSAPFPTSVDSTHSSCFKVRHGDPHLYSAGLVDGVIGSQRCLFAYTDPPQSMAASSVCPQEPSRGADCISMEGSPCWSTHSPRVFTIPLAAVEAHLLLWGCILCPYITLMTSYMVRRLPTRWPALAISLSFHCHFRLGFVIDLQKLTLILSQVMIYLGGLINTARGLVFPSLARQRR